MKTRRYCGAMLGVLTLGLVEAGMMGACGSSTPDPLGSGSSASSTGGETECPASVEVPCMRYHIPLDGNPSTDVALRNKYIAAFGTACYMSEFDTFDCFYRKWQDACADAVKIAEVSGNAPFDKGYMCQPVAGTEDYTLQVGSDVANYITINYQAAPRQTPLTDINGVPTAVNGLYRDLTDPAQVGPGDEFTKTNSGIPDGDGGFLNQREWVLQVNRNANDGGIRSDLAGFEWPCEGSDGGLTKCTEPVYLDDPAIDAGPDASMFHTYVVAQVHHVVPKKDKRCCPWGTNSYKNAAVISAQLNWFFSNNNPPVEEVDQLNTAKPYPP